MFKREFLIASTALALIAGSGGKASAAAEVQFTLTGNGTIIFDVPENPDVSGYEQYVPGQYFSVYANEIESISPSYNPDFVSMVTFFDKKDGGGLEVVLSNLHVPILSINLTGTGPVQYYGAGSSSCSAECDPVFITGTYENQSGYISGHPVDRTPPYTVTISSVSSAVPEPSTWAMLLMGLAGLGLAAHRRTTRRANLPVSARRSAPFA